MKQEIQFMMERFPAYRDKILRAYENNDEFKSLCEDYYSSAMILKSRKHKVIRIKKSELEYRRLFLDLETEVLNFLDLK